MYTNYPPNTYWLHQQEAEQRIIQQILNSVLELATLALATPASVDPKEKQ